MEEGALSAGERFDRVELTLTRIEGKLDGKVDTRVVEALLARITLLEAGETPLGKAMLNQFDSLQKQVADVVLHGSQQAQAGLERIGSLEASVDALQVHREALNAREVQRDQNSSKAFRAWTLVFTMLSSLALIVSVVVAVIVATHVH